MALPIALPKHGTDVVLRSKFGTGQLPMDRTCSLHSKYIHANVLRDQMRPSMSMPAMEASSCRQMPAAPRAALPTTSCRIPCRAAHARHSTSSRLSQLQLGGSFLAGSPAVQLRAGQCRSRQQIDLQTRAADAGAAELKGNRGPPSALVRVASAFLYIVPWIDVLSLGREVYHFFPTSLVLYLLPGPLAPLYYSGQFVPLIVFFLLFLAIVKNKKLHHFVRFNCMQGVMLDIVSMLFTLLRAYVPAEFRWSLLMDFYDIFAWNICMCTIAYCVFFALAGKYADVPYVSESVYLQVDASL